MFPVLGTTVNLYFYKFGAWLPHISKMSISFLILWLRCAHVSTAVNKQVHIFIQRLHNYCQIALAFHMGPGLRIRAMCFLPTHPPLVVLLLLQFHSPPVGLV